MTKTESVLIADLHNLGHGIAATDLHALVTLREAGSRGVHPSTLPGFPAVLTRLSGHGYPNHSEGKIEAMRVFLDAR